MLSITTHRRHGALAQSASGHTISRGISPVTPTQALVASFQGTGLLDALLVFDPAHYSAPGNTPGALVDALGGPITFAAPNTQATPTAVAHSSGYYYAAGDGVDDALTGATALPQQVAWGVLLGRWHPTAVVQFFPVTLGYHTTGDNGYVLRSGPDAEAWAADENNANALPVSGGVTGGAVPTTWALVDLGAIISVPSTLVLSIFGAYDRPVCADLAVIGLRFTVPTSNQQTQIAINLAPVQQALLASAS